MIIVAYLVVAINEPLTISEIPQQDTHTDRHIPNYLLDGDHFLGLL